MTVNNLISSFKGLFFHRKVVPGKNISALDKIIAENHYIDSTFSIMEPFGIAISGNESKITIDANVYFRKFCNIIVSEGGCLNIDKNVFFNNYCSLNCLGRISIGENTLFGEGVKIYDHNHYYEFNENSLHVDRGRFKIGFVDIGKNCWIGSQVVILPNVTIGDNVIIGANNLIYKSIPSNVVVKQKNDFIIESL